MINDKFTKCIGIELLDSLFNLSKELGESVQSNQQMNRIEFYKGDIILFKYDFRNTSMFFSNCKTFNKELMTNMAIQLNAAEPGTFMITSFQTINQFDESWAIIGKFKKLMSWGSCTIYVHIKVLQM